MVYGSAYERIYGDSYQNNVLKKRRTYVNGLYEQEKDYTTNKTKETFYIFGGDGLVAIRVNDDTGDNVTYVHKDHLGSIQCLTNDAGALAQEMSYDAWGNRRDPVTWQVYTTPQAGLKTDRGFTGHEHIDLFALVNMDGRVYDPVIGRFLSADPVIQDPENLQSLNRYAYCINNPLSLTDPSGYSWLSDNWKSLLSAAIAITVSVVSLGTATALGAVILSGALGGFAGGFSGALLNGGNLGQALVAGVIGGVIGGATAFLSYAAGGFSNIEMKSLTKLEMTLIKAGRHAFADAWMGGVKSAISGGEWSPIRDMIGGAVSSVGNGFINEDVNGIVLKTASSAVLGGTIAEIGGGKFANGAITGAYGMLFNEGLHNVAENNAKKKIATLESGIRSVLSNARPGTKITSRELIDKYGIPKSAALLINSFTVNSASSIGVDWNWRASGVEALSNARFKDGTLNVSEVSIQQNRTFDGVTYHIGNALHLTGGAIGINVGGKVDWDIYLWGNFACPNTSFNPVYPISN